MQVGYDVYFKREIKQSPDDYLVVGLGIKRQAGKREKHCICTTKHFSSISKTYIATNDECTSNRTFLKEV